MMMVSMFPVMMVIVVVRHSDKSGVKNGLFALINK